MIDPLHINMWLGIMLELALLASLMAGLTLYQRRYPLAPETSRKLFHIGGGLTTLTFPWLFTSFWPVILLALMIIPSLLALKYIRMFKGNLGTILYSIDRTSFGEIYFPISVCLLFVIVGAHAHPLFFIIPVLILTLADPMAAIIGGRYGHLRYLTIKGQKSVEGSAAFFLVAFFCTYVPLLLFTNIGRVEGILSAALVALLITLVEAVSWNGLDNLLIPLASYFMLMLASQLPIQLLLLDIAIVLFTLIIAYCTVRVHWTRSATGAQQGRRGGNEVGGARNGVGGRRNGVGGARNEGRNEVGGRRNGLVNGAPTSWAWGNYWWGTQRIGKWRLYLIGIGQLLAVVQRVGKWRLYLMGMGQLLADAQRIGKWSLYRIFHRSLHADQSQTRVQWVGKWRLYRIGMKQLLVRAQQAGKRPLYRIDMSQMLARAQQIGKRPLYRIGMGQMLARAQQIGKRPLYRIGMSQIKKEEKKPC